jgi:hypothetical protein
MNRMALSRPDRRFFCGASPSWLPRTVRGSWLGNGHMMMLEKNELEIAAFMADWLQDNVEKGIRASIRYEIDTRWSYEIFLIDRSQSEWCIWAAICETEKACCACLDLYFKESSNWRSDCTKVGLLLIATNKESTINDAAIFLFSFILRLRVRGSFMGPIKCGLLSEAQLRSADQEVRKEREKLCSLTETIGKNSRIIRLARQLHLRPCLLAKIHILGRCPVQDLLTSGGIKYLSQRRPNGFPAFTMRLLRERKRLKELS